MLFDLRTGKRRNVVKFTYLSLAVLMFVGFVFFGIGSSGLSGSIGDLLRDTGAAGGENDPVNRLTRQVETATRQTRANPQNEQAWASLALARVRLAQVGDNFDSAAGDYTAEGRRMLAQAGRAWDRYIALEPKNPDERLVRQMQQAFVALNQPDKAVAAQEILTEIDPTQQTFQNLALLAYQAGQMRKGDLAADKAVELAPKEDRKELRQQLEQAKSQAAAQQIQQAVPSPTPTVG